MRLHHLSVRAFGPFAEQSDVDFDELNEAGLFLLTGPTGAGKSSLLDAVCFALYGTVPGVRGVKTLKSQHAAADVQPVVVLDFSVQGRRFVIRRTPEWTRPKRRGDGLIQEKASASITEMTGGTEHFLSPRAAEVGHLVTGLMGMNAGQFVQVALLPQGEFQTFLRASSQDRHAVLQQLFRTDRFSRIEDWVHDRSRMLQAEAQSGGTDVARILHAVAERTAGELPDDVGGERLAAAASEGRTAAWVEERLWLAEGELAAARAVDDAAQAALLGARGDHEVATRRAEQRTRLEAAQRTLAELDETADRASEAVALLSADDRATRCLPVLGMRLRALDAHARASTRSRASDDLPSGEALSSTLETVRERVATLRALLPREQAASRMRRDLDLDRRRLIAAEAEQALARARAEQLPAEIDALERRSAAATVRAARREAAERAVREAEGRAVAAVDLVEVRARLDDLEDARRDARDAVHDARERAQDLVGRRLAGMAAELAGALTDGVACQVCGSADHPAPATAADDSVTQLDQDAADAELAERRASLERTDLALAALRRRHDELVVTSGGCTPEEATASRVARTGELSDALAAELELTGLSDQLRSLRDEQVSLGDRQSEIAATVAAATEAIAAHERSLEAVAAEIEEAIGVVTEATTVGEALARLSAMVDRLARAQQAARELDEASQRLDALTAEALTVLAAHGFTAFDEVESTVLAPEDRRELEALLERRSSAQARARAVLDDPALLREDGAPADPVSLADDLRAAEAAASEAARSRALLDDRVTALRRLRDRLDVAMTAWAPLRDQALQAESMSKLVRGMGSDNQLQMRLSAYVLATRLDQVVAAANERLGLMRDQRYLLQRSGRAERRGAQSGLGLEVVDQWTGDVRAPSTLSGGETFVVSLSLALGLADVVTHEAGGTEIETLFVDEGFGTLDADTLDDVMDRLDGLRAGGRTVGVVSHVTELRSRIPTQVQVDKGRNGSTVDVRTLVG